MADSPSPAPEIRSSYERFNRGDRIAHLLLIISFSALVITGIPQKFVPAAWAETMIGLMGGIETVRVIHRLSAIVLIIVSVYHVLAVAYRLFVRRRSPAMLPGLKDFTDFLQALRFNLGLSGERPRYDRYSFEEKIEYWAVIWGTVIMVITGFMLWNPISTTRVLPGSWVPAAKAAHGGEALLAFLAIIVWHFYNVHIKTFNRSIFTGKLTREEMAHEHPTELERIENGWERPEPSAATLQRRRRVFIPAAAVIVIVAGVALYVFVTFEQTAIATLPPQPDRVDVFVPASPTPPTPAAGGASLDPGAASIVPHEIVGRENCLACHGAGAIAPYTAIHAELQLTNDTCLACHSAASDKTITVPELTSALVPSFAVDILPALQRRCTACHNSTAELNLMSYDTLMAGGASGPVVAPGDPETSRILLVQRMPLTTHPTRLSSEELELVRAWILAGAPNN